MMKKWENLLEFKFVPILLFFTFLCGKGWSIHGSRLFCPKLLNLSQFFNFDRKFYLYITLSYFLIKLCIILSIRPYLSIYLPISFFICLCIAPLSKSVKIDVSIFNQIYSKQTKTLQIAFQKYAKYVIWTKFIKFLNPIECFKISSKM